MCLAGNFCVKEGSFILIVMMKLWVESARLGICIPIPWVADVQLATCNFILRLFVSLWILVRISLHTFGSLGYIKNRFRSS